MLLRKLLTGTRKSSGLQCSLAALARLYGHHETLEALLQAAAEMVAHLLVVDYCGVVWCEENEPSNRVHSGYGKNNTNGYSEQAERLIASLIQDKSRNDLANINVGRRNGRLGNDANKNGLIAPLRVNTRMVGYIYAINAEKTGEVFPSNDRVLFATLSEHIGLAIEKLIMRQKMASHYVSTTLDREEKAGAVAQHSLESHILTSVEDPEKVARIIARTFYKDLRKAGFETKQILVVATELIGNLNEALQKTRAKTEENGNNNDQKSNPKSQTNSNFQSPISNDADELENWAIGY